MRKLLPVLLILGILTPAHAQVPAATALLASAYDVAATSYTYSTFTGGRNSVYGSDLMSTTTVTAAASTTVAAVTASSNPFADVSVGDLIFFRTPTGVTTRLVTARASADSITVNSSTTVTAQFFTWRKFHTGTTATDGWFNVADHGIKSVEICVSTINATSLGFSIEGKLAGAPAAATLIAPVYTATGCDVYPIPETLDQIRVGEKVNTDTGVQSITIIYQSSTAGH